MTKPRFTYETKRTCGRCHRQIDAIRAPGINELLYSRHLSGSSGFCASSLVEAAPEPKSR